MAARRDDRTAKVWKGDVQSAAEDRGITILGTPVGTPEFVTRQREKKVSEHEEIVEQDSGHQGSPVCVACVALLRHCKGRTTF